MGLTGQFQNVLNISDLCYFCNNLTQCSKIPAISVGGKITGMGKTAVVFGLLS